MTMKRMIHLLKNHRYNIKGKIRTLKHMGFKSNEIELWYENDAVKEFMDHMPEKEMVLNLFSSYAVLSRMKVKYIFIVDDWEDVSNWYYPDDQVWAITLFASIDTLLSTMKSQNQDISLLEAYCIKHKLIKRKDV